MQEYSTIWGAERMSVGMRRALGVAALIDAALGLGSTISVAAMSAGSRIVLPAVWVSPGSPAFYIRAALSLVVLFGLWRLARPGIGSHLILTGVILETVWSLAVAGAVLFAPTSSAPVQSAFTALIPYLNWIGSLVYLLIGVGLLVGTDLPRWVPWLAIFSAFAAGYLDYVAQRMVARAGGLNPARSGVAGGRRSTQNGVLGNARRRSTGAVAGR